MQKFPTMVPVVAAALIGSDGRVLMQKRHADRMHGGLWEFPGGKLEAAESAQSGLIRELREELGIVVCADSLSWIADSAAPESPIVISLYTCRAWRGAVQCLDAQEIAWFMPGELAGLAMPPLDVPLAEALNSNI